VGFIYISYLFEVIDAASGAVQYSRGFSSIYGEWETTGEAKAIHRTFSESMRCSRAREAGSDRVEEARRQERFRDVWTIAIDPSDKFVVRGAESPTPAR